uniref:Uncharacterized protein n=1 Tax=Arundo donax TaxID=35708 RepID=A0A0A9HMG3_ARUDO
MHLQYMQGFLDEIMQLLFKRSLHR